MENNKYSVKNKKLKLIKMKTMNRLITINENKID
jgi:hypothetical protein